MSLHKIWSAFLNADGRGALFAALHPDLDVRLVSSEMSNGIGRGPSVKMEIVVTEKLKIPPLDVGINLHEQAQSRLYRQGITRPHPGKIVITAWGDGGGSGGGGGSGTIRIKEVSWAPPKRPKFKLKKANR